MKLLLAALLAAAPGALAAPGDSRVPGSSRPQMMFFKIQPETAAPGQEVVITGLQFMEGARVWLGGSEAGGVRVENQNRLVATVPEHKPGKVSIMIQNPDGRSVARGLSFRYLAGPAPAGGQG